MLQSVSVRNVSDDSKSLVCYDLMASDDDEVGGEIIQGYWRVKALSTETTVMGSFKGPFQT